MKYNFDLEYDRRGSYCLKWDAIGETFGREDVIPLWIADMDFPVAQPILEAIKKRAEHPFFGYTRPCPSVIEAVVERLQRKFNWKIQPEWVVFTPGVIPALNIAIRSITHPGDGIVLQEPVYYPFFSATVSSGCQIINNGLKLVNGRYEMDFEGLANLFPPLPETQTVAKRIKGIILCNPHNPVGRLWERQELVRLGEIIFQHGGVVISDEVHCELLFRGYRHTTFASISEDFARNSIICMAPSKTFNLAGLESSCIIIPNPKLRQTFTEVQTGITPWPNLFGLTALEAAFRYGDDWLEQVLDYLQSNLDFMMEYFATRIPRIKVIQPQATYLIWLDCRELGLGDLALRRFIRERARVGLDDGFVFGEGGSGFQRINIACPRSVLQEALGRIEAAVHSLGKTA